MDFNEIITFEGGINTDDTPQGVPKGDYRDFSYCRLGYNSGNAFAVETSDGTIEINNPSILEEDKVIGATQWLKENAIVYFVYKYSPPPVPPFPPPPVPHQIWVYYIATQTHQLVVQDLVLNFSPDWPIFHSNVIDDILKWTDGRWDDQMYEDDGTRLFNPPYQINLRKALDGFYTIYDLQTIDAIKWPMEPPIVSYFTDTTRNDNKLRGKLFKFIIQPIYENGEIGVWSMYSNLALPDKSELVSGTNWIYPNNDNVIRIQFDTGPKVIRGFNVAVQEFDRNDFGTIPPFGIFLQLDKVQDSINDNAFHTISFYGNAAISSAVEVFKNYDRLPIVADCQEYLPTNQLAYSNFREGYDKPTDPPFKLDVSMGYDVNEILWIPQDFDGLFEVLRGSTDANFTFRYQGTAYANANTELIFQADDVIQFVTWANGASQFNNKRLFYSVSQEEINTALTYPTPFDQNAYIMRLIGDSFLQQWGANGFFEFPATISTYLTFGIEYEATYFEGFNGPVRAADEQGTKLILGGDFTTVSDYDGQRICRIIKSTGNVDNTFDVGTGFNDDVLSLNVLADNSIIVGGSFTSFNGTTSNRITKLSVNGAIDSSFNTNTGTGFNGDVYAVSIQSDGKIIVGGNFTEFNTVSRNKIARLNSNGTLDTSFNPGTGIVGSGQSIFAIEIQSTEKIIIGGNFSNYDTFFPDNIARLNTDGSFDNTFLASANGVVLTIQRMPSSPFFDELYIGGGFTECNTVSRNRIARLNADGSLDGGFNPGTGFNNTVRSIKRKTTGGSTTIYVCGSFTTYDSATVTQLIQIDDTGGAVDSVNGTFTSGSPSGIYVYESSDDLIAFGNFEYVDGSDFRSYAAMYTENFFNSLVLLSQVPGGTSVNLPWGSLKDLEYDRTTGVLPTLKVGATHEFGIVYGDRAYRDSTVYTIDSMNLFVPWFYDINERYSFTKAKNPFTVTPKTAINHIPPVWATKYWIVAKPATEILSFGQYITNQRRGASGLMSSIVVDSADNRRYKIFLDSYYRQSNKGTNIRHEIKVGDKLRFKRNNGYYLDYVPYLELDILEVGTTPGPNGEQIVYTTIFESSLIQIDLDITSANFLFGQELEIYTPRPSVDDTGNIFVSTWNDITEAIQIKNPHTEDRSHGSPVQHYIQVGGVSGVEFFYISGDQSQLNGTTNWPATIYYIDGSVDQDTTDVTSAIYNSIDNITTITLSAVSADLTIAYITLNGQDQVVSNFVSTTAAFYPINYGDVYIRQRVHATGYQNEADTYYYYQEDPNYSDYWPSSIYNTGRLRIEDQNAKMVHRRASSIHSESFVLGTQINGLSSFALDNQNIEDMNPLYGGIVRTYMSGREGKTLKCIQPKRENSIYIQFYPNEVGSDSTVRVSNKTFASWFDYKSLFGCSYAGATALLPNGSVMYFDNNSGVFIYSGGNGQMAVSEIDPDTGKDYKFRTKTKELAKAYNESANPIVRTYINETVGEVGFAFSFDNEETYEHVVFDYVNMRWRSTYNYNFREFCNLGQTLVGWGKDNQLYLHNQPGEWTFHGDPFIQKVTFVSNENPLMLKRYQDITLVSDDKFSIEASSEPNRSYPLGMKTLMSENIINTFEGYGKTNYRKNLYDPRFFVVGNVSDTNTTTWILNGNQTSLVGETITIVQNDKNIYTGVITNPVYNSGPNNTDIELVGLQPDTIGEAGTWYLSEKVLLNGEDVRANALTHTLSYDPTPGGIPGEGSVLFSVGIKGVLS